MVVVAAWGGVAAQDEASGQGAEMAAMEEAMAKAAAPGAQHEYLSKFAGRWRAQMRMFVGGETIEGRGVADCEMVLGGRFLQTRYKGELAGRNFIGIGLDGYDNLAQKFVSTWADTNGTTIVMLEGDDPGEGEPHTMTGSYVDPATGKTKHVKSEIKFASTNRYTYEMWEKEDGGEYQRSMQAIFSRSE
jgi:hypothetical protein